MINFNHRQELVLGQHRNTEFAGFADMLVRVISTYKLKMHIDTDEGNAAELKMRDVEELKRTDAKGTLRKTNRFR